MIVDIAGGCNLENGPWIAGGCARRLWFGQEWIKRDVDFFFSNKEDFDNAVKTVEKYTSKTTQSKPISDFGDIMIAKSSPKIHTDNASTYEINLKEDDNVAITLQLIRKNWHKDLLSLFENFDFTVCQFATDGKTIVAPSYAENDCNLKILRQVESSKRRLSARRVIKYAIYGFEPTRKIMKDLVDRHANKDLLEDGTDDYA
jgi:hypothetical protein